MTMVPAQTFSKQQQHLQQHNNILYNTGGTCGGLVDNIINQDATSPLIFGPSTGTHHINNSNNNNDNNNKFGFVEEAATSGYDRYLYYSNSIGGEALVSMADEEDSATITTNETGSTSNNTQPPPTRRNNNELDASEEWLRLGIGGSNSTTDAHHNNTNNNNNTYSSEAAAASQRPRLYLPGGTTTAAFLPPPPPPPVFTGRPSIGPAVPILFYQSHRHHHQLQQPDQLGWANYRSPAQGATTNPRVLAVPSSYSSSLMQYATATQSFLQPRPSPSPSPFQPASSSGGASTDVIRVVDPPPRPHSGIWLTLLPSLNQAKEPFLPPLARNYVRIKDGKMTVGLLIKYLVNKLGLESESEVEIRCRGEELQENLTLQQVRDEIWSARESEMMALLPHSSAAHHVMVIHYAAATSSSSSNSA